MREVLKKVFYCDHCKRHRLSKRAIEQHEAKCVYNPDRVCRWTSTNFGYEDKGWRYKIGAAHPAIDYRELAKTIEPGSQGWLERLREQSWGCPACMLAVIVQARLHAQATEGQYWHEVFSDDGWNYEKEVEAFRQRERETDLRDAF